MGMAQVAVLFLEKPGLDSGLKLKAGQGSNLPPTSWLLQPRALGAVDTAPAWQCPPGEEVGSGTTSFHLPNLPPPLDFI